MMLRSGCVLLLPGAPCEQSVWIWQCINESAQELKHMGWFEV